MKVENQKVVGIDYTLFLEDGSIGDTTKGDEPLYFLFGEGNIIPGLEKALEGMKVGDQTSVEIPPEEAYGEYDPEDFEEIPRNAFPSDDLEVGMTIALMDEDDNHIPGIVQELTEESIIINMNHPLAGKKLKFDVKVIDIREATTEELEHGHVHSHGGHGHHH